MHFMSLAGLPRRYYTNTNFPLFVITERKRFDHYFALIGGASIGFLYNFFVAFFMVKISSKPLESNTLEWTAQ
jgi:cytochrome c oxidase subunit 1